MRSSGVPPWGGGTHVSSLHHSPIPSNRNMDSTLPSHLSPLQVKMLLVGTILKISMVRVRISMGGRGQGLSSNMQLDLEELNLDRGKKKFSLRLMTAR
jgi:hypothetical protein